MNKFFLMPLIIIIIIISQPCLAVEKPLASEKNEPVVENAQMDKDTKLELTDFSIVIPRTWSYEKYIWKNPRVSSSMDVCEGKGKKRKCSKDVPIDYLSYTLILKPSLEKKKKKTSPFDGEFLIQVQDRFPISNIANDNPPKIDEKSDKAFAEWMGIKEIRKSKKIIRDREWLLEDADHDHPPGEMQKSPYRSIDAKTILKKNKEIDFYTAGTYEDMRNYEKAVMEILSSISFKD